MVLGSQQARHRGTFSAGTYRQRKRRRNQRIGMAVVGIVIGGALGYWVFFTGGSEPEGGGEGDQSVAASSTGGEGGSAPGAEGSGGSGGGISEAGFGDRVGGGGTGTDGDDGGVESPLFPERDSSEESGSDDGGADGGDDLAGGGGSTEEANGGGSGARRGSGGGHGPGRPAQSAVDAATSSEVASLIERGMGLTSGGQYVEARRVLNRALKGRIGPDDAERVRERMAELNERLLFSPKADPGDPYTSYYVVESGDSLARIAPRYQVPVGLLVRINNLANPNRIRVGQRLKVIEGPFHAVVSKSDFRIDIYLDAPGEEGLYVRSFAVGLGEYNSTPVGRFIVKPESKLKNPEWVNPRTGERFLADNPENPIGERWIGLAGASERTRELEGYGIHGTIEPESIGREASMGCVRMKPEDVAMVYDLLTQRDSEVLIVR